MKEKAEPAPMTRRASSALPAPPAREKANVPSPTSRMAATSGHRVP